MTKLWNKLLSHEIMKRGWHLARNDIRQDFSEDLYSTDVYAQDLNDNILETINRLRSNTYQPHPLFRMEVPKGTFAFRPGTVIPIKDRVILSAIVLLIAEDIDKKLSDSVYSWRLKDPLPKKGPIFKENDIHNIPYLKKATIRQRIDPFESWYQLWPQFDKETRIIFQEKGYKFLATSDIAAYFENIQLPILRDQLLKYLPDEFNLVNLLFQFLETWVDKTNEGQAIFRGIPQGNFVSSFLGNIFLIPLDEALKKFSKNRDVKYFRYMDDVRIFAKKHEDARLSILTMARKLRELHLNVQSAKTRIYNDNRNEISNLLIDPRVDKLSELIDEISEYNNKKIISNSQKKTYLGKLKSIAKEGNINDQKIFGTRLPLEGLSIRCFIRWIFAHQILDSDYYIERLLKEIKKSANSKFTKKLITTTRRFPRKSKIETSIIEMIKNNQIIFPYQEAECLRALRYLSSIDASTIQHCWKRLLDRKKERYLRMEAAYLLSRIELDTEKLEILNNEFGKEPDPYKQVTIAMLLIQQRKNHQQILDTLVYHPNEKIKDIGKLFQKIRNNKNFAKEKLSNIFHKDFSWIICDNMPFIHLMAESNDKGIKRMLLDAIRSPRKNHPRRGIRIILQKVFTRVHESLRSNSELNRQ